MGIRPQIFHEFYSALHARGETTSTLARKCGVSGGAIRRLISGHRKPAGPTWRKLLEVLTPRERQLLEQTVEQCSTWNVHKRPRFSARIAEAIKTCRDAAPTP